MSTRKALQLAQKSVARQQEVIAGLESLVKSIDRGEQMATSLKTEMEAVMKRHEQRTSTREDIAYLEDLLRCAKKKLAWEKQMAALQKRTPAILAEVSELMNDSANPPLEEARLRIMRSLQAVQARWNASSRRRSRNDNPALRSVAFYTSKKRSKIGRNRSLASAVHKSRLVTSAASSERCSG